MGRRLYVGNLSYNTTEMDLRDAFGQFGTVADAKVVMDRETGRPRGFAFVEMSSDDEAAQAIDRLDGKDFKGRPLKINEARAREGGRPGGGYSHGAGQRR